MMLGLQKEPMTKKTKAKNVNRLPLLFACCRFDPFVQQIRANNSQKKLKTSLRLAKKTTLSHLKG